MIIIKLQGGLGNQMFQYAHGRSLELLGKKVVFDTSFFSDNKARMDTARNFKLDKYDIQTTARFSDKKHPVLDTYIKIKRALGLNMEISYPNIDFFECIHDRLTREFTLKSPLTKRSLALQGQIMTARYSVSLHIRRGDYVTDKNTREYHGSCDIDYYRSAIQLISKKLALPVSSLDIFVFSDDINWAKDELHFPYKVYFVSDSEIPDYEEMHLMSLCHYNVIANSTFSWWAAWLNQNPDKIVIVPKQWLKDKTSAQLRIIPNDWTAI